MQGDEDQVAWFVESRWKFIVETQKTAVHFNCFPKGQSMNEDLKTLQGFWDVVAFGAEGKIEKVSDGEVVSVSGTTISFHTHTGTFSHEFHVDSTQTPRWLDMFERDGYQLGIYELIDNDHWRLCYQFFTQESRPIDFSTAQYATAFYEFRRRPNNQPPEVETIDELEPGLKLPHQIASFDYKGYRLTKYRSIVDTNQVEQISFFKVRKIYDVVFWWYLESSSPTSVKQSNELKRFGDRLEAERFIDSVS